MTFALLFRRDDDGKARETEANIMMTRATDTTVAASQSDVLK